MKVCCMTFINTRNYGTCLQAYALQTAAEGLGHSYRIIRYQSEVDRRWSSLFLRPVGMPLKTYLFRLLPSFPVRLYRTAKFAGFTRKHLRFTAPCKTLDDLRALDAQADAFLCGSDVIWRNDMTGYDPAFYLCFTEKRRIAYAPSLGKSAQSERDGDMVRRWVPPFYAVSVREKSGAELVSQWLNRPVAVALDPTLLLTKRQWAELAALPAARAPYILVYSGSLSPALSAFAERLSRITGHRVIHTSAKAEAALREKAGFPTPRKWLGLLLNAGYVVTNSFHGTAFAVNFQKNFYTVVEGKPTDAANVRLYDFLDGLSLADRICRGAEDAIDLRPPDYGIATPRLQAAREQSMLFLESSLAGNAP